MNLNNDLDDQMRFMNYSKLGFAKFISPEEKELKTPLDFKVASYVLTQHFIKFLDLFEKKELLTDNGKEYIFNFNQKVLAHINLALPSLYFLLLKSKALLRLCQV